MNGVSTNVDVGALNYQRALRIARNTEGDLDPDVREHLERALNDIRGHVRQRPDSYILTKDEFAILNFYLDRFEGHPDVEAAISRYWQHAQAPNGSHNSKL
ncbi:hypothetical protein LTR56_022907 [Elasticomyces elasticus]|nr:hypothetical protein LTR56_022907 [Elasticomyces elasticus]KAK3626929.1 hypothetical protein LTR22_022964 [Elasticomyces elasticus]KAK4907541.1 hypothetical protein LTR49_023445 [Elasticomyces elasticus]